MTRSEQWDCIMMNNRGVDMIHESNFDNAIWCLQKGLIAIKNYHSRYGRRYEQVDQHSCNSAFVAVNEWIAKSKVTMEQQQHQSHKVFTKTQSNYPYLCTTPITIYEEFDSTTNNVEPTQPPMVHAAIVLFNLAVAYNLKGIIVNDKNNSNGDNTNLVHIRTAITLYELCHGCIQDEIYDFGPYFMMTLANNLGVCNSLLHDHHSANEFFQYLLSLQMYVLDCRQLRCNYVNDNDMTDDQAGGLEEITKGFWYNTSKLILSDCTAPAA